VNVFSLMRRNRVMKNIAYRVVGYFALLLMVFAVSVISWGLDSQSFAEATTDLYFKTPGTPQGPAAPSPQETVYSHIGEFDSRLLVWFVTQLHTYFGGFVLALPIFCMLLEFLGLSTKNPALALRYDGLARDLAKVALLALSVTAVLGTVMLGIFLSFYPSFTKYMGGTFKSFMPVYAIVFVGTSLFLVVYYYSWNRMAEPALKWGHASIGLLANIFGTALLLLANSWSAFMMSPSGVDAQGRFLGNGWHLLHSALWNPLNVHRFLADIMSGGAVVLAYACYRFFTSKTDQSRAYFDWVGHVFLFVMVCALLPMPFAGYWLMRSVYAFSQGMGMTMMGGLLTWLFVVQALLIGVLFLGINFYMWQSMARLRGGERYQPYYQALLSVFMLALLIWLTPHTVFMSAGEVKAMGGASHPVVGNYGVMSAKNGAINIMILVTAMSFLYYRRANRTMVVSWITKGNILIGAFFLLGAVNIIWLSVYGYYLPAKLRVGLSTPQAATTLTILVVCAVINRMMLKGAIVHGPVQWGKISLRGMVGLFGLAVAFSWVMGLMGYIRSSGRLAWHVSELMADVSPWAFTPDFAFAAKMVTLNMMVFWGAVFVLFWISQRDQSSVMGEEPVEENTRVLVPPSSSQEA
jgi:cytochrome bd ubiquinol oxidase subunit I